MREWCDDADMHKLSTKALRFFQSYEDERL